MAATLATPTTPADEPTAPSTWDVQQLEADIRRYGLARTFMGRLNASGTAGMTVAGLVFVVWVLAGLAAFVTSLVCLGLEGNMNAKLAGVFFAILLGPFYWVYFGVLYSRKEYGVRA